LKAGRVHKLGGPEVITVDDVARPKPGTGEMLIRVAAAGVGPWDALLRSGASVVDVALPLTLGSDLSGVVEEVGPGVTNFKPGDAIYGVTNANFCGAYAEYSVVSGGMVASKPAHLSYLESASVPVVAVTAWQMLFDYAKAQPGQTVLIHGAAGNVGAFATQLARYAHLQIYATASAADADFVRSLGAANVIDHKATPFESAVPPLDIVLDTVGGETRLRSYAVLKPGGILVSAVSPITEPPDPRGVRSVFFLVEVTTERLNALNPLLANGTLKTQVGTVLPLQQAPLAHEMLAGAPHKRGKIVLNITPEMNR